MKFPAFLLLPGAVYRSIAKNMVSTSAAWVWACLLKMALLILGLHWVFTASFLDPKSPTKALLFMDAWQIIAVEGGIFDHLANITPFHSKF